MTSKLTYYHLYWLDQVLNAPNKQYIYKTPTKARITAVLPGGDRSVEIDYVQGKVRLIND